MGSCARCQVRVYLDADLTYHSYALAGLHALVRVGAVDLQYRLGLRSPLARTRHDPPVLLFEVRPSGQSRWVCVAFDAWDDRSRFCQAALSWADLYFKANYSAPATRTLPAEFARRVRPGGLLFPVRLDIRLVRAGILLAGAVLAHLAPGHFSSLPKGEKNLGRALKTATWAYRHRLRLRDYEACQGVEPHPRQVFFNGTFWHPEHERDQNEMRAGVIRLARQNPRCDFVGGFRPDSRACEFVPDLVLAPDPSHRQYVEMVAGSAVVINALGPSQCFSWKLPEYLAAGRCILSQPLENELPQPLQDGEEIRYFRRDLSDFDEKLTELMEDPVLRRHLAEGAWRYYGRWVRPSAAIHRMLNEAVALA